MKLDKRIKAITDIQSVTSGCHDWEFMTKKGYFADNLEEFRDLTKCVYGEYMGYAEKDKCFTVEVRGNATQFEFRYFIPEADLKPVEKKYRHFTLKEFLTSFSMLTDITIREKGNIDCVIVCTVTAYRMRIICNDICLGVEWFSLKELFDKYEFKDGLGNWQPFGVIVEENE